MLEFELINRHRCQIRIKFFTLEILLALWAPPRSQTNGQLLVTFDAGFTKDYLTLATFDWADGDAFADETLKVGYYVFNALYFLLKKVRPTITRILNIL